MKTISLLWHTVRYLKLRQIAYQVLNRLRPRPRLKTVTATPVTGTPVSVPPAEKPVTFRDGAFTFLNQTQAFPEEIDWNYSGFGKLWTYNLNYFDFLNQPGLSPAAGIVLIQNFIRQTDHLADGLEPYPTSLRILNWIQFLSRHRIQDTGIDQHLYAQSDLLRTRLEYHLEGNHLLENGFALLTAAVYFREQTWFGRAAGLLRQELTAQLLNDGAHEERSPMYHQILLDRLLDLTQLLQADSWHQTPDLSRFMAEQARRMLGWLEAVTFSNGDIPYVNDAAPGIAPTTEQLREKAGRLGLRTTAARLGDSGYRMIRREGIELFMDVGAVGPDHQPGHAHADTFSFVLYINKHPIIVDLGISTYQIGQQRQMERSTAAHNTVTVGDMNSSAVWGGFRVGRRARVCWLQESPTSVSARHDGYRRLGAVHERTWQVETDKIIITDRLLGRAKSIAGVARLHLHPEVALTAYTNNFRAGPILLTFEGGYLGKYTVQAYAMANSFNLRQAATCLAIPFNDSLITTITVA